MKILRKIFMSLPKVALVTILFISNIVYADTTLSFTPPASDYSVVFLENVFGVVDGVLSGTGSQILGSMFSIFNAAVLALGGIVIMYILIVGTLNTAQEGTMLGQKWNSLWIPVRATLGLALLMPKASGYCVMQIFVMWVIVQGVGAADKLWDAALNYLNNGGQIINAQMSSQSTLSTAGGALPAGAAAILANQVCMLGVQAIMDNQRQIYTNAQSDNPNICTGTPEDASIAAFCGGAMPNFLATFNAVAQQQQIMDPTTGLTPDNQVTVPVPYFDSNSPYSSLKGICGSISWPTLNSSQVQSLNSNSTSTSTESSSDEVNVALMTPAIAIQQMYTELAIIATSMVGNDPQLAYPQPVTAGNNSTQFAAWANEQYGVVYNSSDSPCTQPSSSCVSWGLTTGLSTGMLFNGTEFQNAVQSYNAIMDPTLKLINQSNSSDKNFITDAELDGWMTAGSYFYNLLLLTGSPQSGNSTISTFPSQQTNYANLASTCTNKPQLYSLYCSVFNGSTTMPQYVTTLIQGNSSPIPLPQSSSFTNPKYNSNYQSQSYSSTTLGYIYNAAMIILPGQVGTVSPSFNINMNLSPPPTLMKLPEMTSFPCGSEWMLGCVGQVISIAIYDGIIAPLFTYVLSYIDTFFEQIIQVYLYVPMNAMGQIFVNGVAYLANPNNNPIVSLAQMGATYINYAMELWIQLVTSSVMFVFFPGFAVMLALILPILMSWLGVMLTIGFSTAYYVPFLPYVLFTFGVLAWLSAVVEAMVGAPIVALGITHPDGDGLLGNGEQGIMLLLNVFLRPAMMVLGYIAGISLCYVGVWILNTGYQNVADNIQPGRANLLSSSYYGSWAGMFGGFMAIVMYTTLYMTIAQKSFNMIYILPDKVLRWIKGGQAEGVGEQSERWSEESKGQMKQASDSTEKAGASTSAKMDAKANAAIGQAKDASKGDEVQA